MKDPERVKRGKKSRASGAAFELRVRKDLEEKNWIVDKWSNNVEIVKAIDEAEFHEVSIMGVGSLKPAFSVKKFHIAGKLAPAKRKYAGPGRPMAIGTGFPDFISFKSIVRKGQDLEGEPIEFCIYHEYEIVGVEVKTNGYLDKEEKLKCRWLLDNNIFSKILIAEKTKVKNKIIIVYHDFEEKYGKKKPFC